MVEVISILALDVGDKRVGLAAANSLARLPRALTTLDRSNVSFWRQLTELIENENIQQIVVGLPRGLDGQETEQTLRTRNFATELSGRFKVQVAFQDEALTSWQAENELGSSKKPFSKSNIDALSAVYILEDYLNQQQIETKANG